jgi:nitric-oxide synthase
MINSLASVKALPSGGSSQKIEEARAFLRQYETEKGQPQTQRIADVTRALAADGTYHMTSEELFFASQISWRNSVRCNGRRFWRGLRMNDLRHVTTEEEVFEGCVEHIRKATNSGKLVPMATIFPQVDVDGQSIRIWNHQLIRYAGYRQGDGTVIGDPAEVDVTEQALKLGWKGKGGRFDILPLIIQFPGREPKLFEIPRDAVLEVDIVHPDLPWFAELGLTWYALPAISEMMMDAGGIQYGAAVFSGWYMDTEIGSRNFGDERRYNLLPVVAEKMGLSTRHDRSLWKDRAMLELNVAVIHSYRQAGVMLVDHHTASRDFMRFVAQEEEQDRDAMADWSWMVPPMSGSACSVFHTEFKNVELKPNFYYQACPWDHSGPRQLGADANKRCPLH